MTLSQKKCLALIQGAPEQRMTTQAVMGRMKMAEHAARSTLTALERRKLVRRYQGGDTMLWVVVES